MGTQTPRKQRFQAGQVQLGRYQLRSYPEKAPGDPFTGRVVGAPRREDVRLDVDESAVLEHHGHR